MVILRGCARCGGDILTGNARNVRCLQCGHKPDASLEELRRQTRQTRRAKTPTPVNVKSLFGVQCGAPDATEDDSGIKDADIGARCPQCEETDSIALDKLRPHFNTCYRCRLCGHIFSPAAFRAAS